MLTGNLFLETCDPQPPLQFRAKSQHNFPYPRGTLPHAWGPFSTTRTAICSSRPCEGYGAHTLPRWPPADSRGIRCRASCGREAPPQNEAVTAPVHPSAVLQLGQLPVDVTHAAYSLASEELYNLYDVPLVAPRSFLHVNSRRQPVAAPPPPPPLSHPHPHPVATAEAAEETAASGEAAAAANGASTPTATAPSRTPERGTHEDASYGMHGVTDADMLSLARSAAASGFLRSDPRGARRRSRSQPEHLQLLEHLLVGIPSQPQQQPSSSAQARTLAAEAGGQRQLAAAANRSRGRGRATTALSPTRADGRGGGDGGDGGRSWRGGVVWRGDAEELAALPSERLGTVLLECSRQRVPLRLSALQAYLDEVSSRCLELPADDLITCLEGLACYSFRTRGASEPRNGTGAATQSPSSPTGAVWAAGGPTDPRRLPAAAGNTSAAARERFGPGSGSRFSRGSDSGSEWADPILWALLEPLGTDPDGDEVRGGASPRWDRGGDETGGGVAVAAGGGTDAPATVPVEGAPRAAALSYARSLRLVRLLGQLAVQPPQRWLAAFLDCTAHLVPELGGAQLLELLAALTALGVPAEGGRWWSAVLDAWGPPRTTRLGVWHGATGEAGRSGAVAGDPGAGEPLGVRQSTTEHVESSRAHEHGSSSAAEGDRLAGRAARGGGTPGDAAGPSVLEVQCGVLYHAARLVRTPGVIGTQTSLPSDGYAVRNQWRRPRPWGSRSGGGSGRTAGPARQRATYGAAGRGQSQSPRGAVLSRSHLARWATEALYDVARALLPFVPPGIDIATEGFAGSANAAAADGNSGSDGSSDGSGSSSQRHSAKQEERQRHPSRHRHEQRHHHHHHKRSRTQPTNPPAGPVQAAFIAMAVTSLRRVLRNPRTWVSEPSGRGGATFSVLLAALQPHLADLPTQLLLELLEGFVAARIHPGPVFLRHHTAAFRSRVPGTPPRQLLRVAGNYQRLGMMLSGGLRSAYLEARRKVQLEAARRQSALARLFRDRAGGQAAAPSASRPSSQGPVRPQHSDGRAPSRQSAGRPWKPLRADRPQTWAGPRDRPGGGDRGGR